MISLPLLPVDTYSVVNYSLIVRLRCFGVFILSLFLLSEASGQSNPDQFYYVADSDNTLYTWDRSSLSNNNIGGTGVGAIEAIAFWPLPGDRRLFATNAGEFGVIDTTTGTFTSIAEIDGGGTANGEEGPQPLNDVDGLAFDGQTGRLWASERNSASGAYDYIFLIDTATGNFVQNAFGLGIDYLVVDGEGLFEDIDDIAFNPITGLIYANSNIGGSNDLLIQINKFTGEVDAVTSLSEDDVEGLTFHNDGQMYGAEGDDSRVSTVDETTGNMVVVSSLDGGDPEAIAALVADASTVTGRVFEDANFNLIDDTEAGLSDITVELYLDVDSNGLYSQDDQLIQTIETDANGRYSFYFATVGYLVVRLRESSIPAGYANTTDLLETAVFLDTISFGETDSLNDFGLATGPDCDGDGIPNFYEGSVDTDSDGVPDSCDLDSDDDGILDALSRIQDFDNDGLPDYLDLDSDNDGIPDAIEANGGYAPSGYDASTGRIAGADGDSDGLKTSVDAAPGVAYGSGSTTTLPIPDTDGDGREDQIDLDADNDGILDIVEGGGADSDGDGEIDGFTDSNSDGYHDPLTSGPYVISNADSTYEAGNAMELKPNYRDNDSDNDGIDDTREGQSTAGYETAILNLDSDNDGIVDFWDTSVGGSSIDPVDIDGDGTPDYFDLDTDNDGVIDFIEGNDADMNGVADVALSNLDLDSNGIDDAFDGGCTLTQVTSTLTSHGEQQGSSVDISSSDLELTRESNEQIVGMYWPSLSVAPNQNVNDAYIQFETDETGFSGTVNLTIWGELSTNPSTFSTSSNDVSNRTRTNDSVNWTITNTWNTAGETGVDQRTPDVSSILEEIVSQNGWTIGNPVAFIIERNGSGSTRRTAEDDVQLVYTPGDEIFAAHGCQSNVAVQNSDNDSERDWRDTDDDADGILTINEDINNNDDWSDDFTQGGSPTPDYLTFSSCPGGTQPQRDTFYLSAVTAQNGITNSANALNTPDDSYAEFYDANDSMTLELPITIQAGEEYTIYYKHRNYSTGLPGGATVRIRESSDGASFTNQPTEPSSFSLINTDSATLTAQVNTRFIRIYNPGTNPDFDFDALSYLRIQCQGDNDGDGIADNIDIDDDNDGIPDLVENTSSLDPTADDDNDGIFNFEDADFCTINSNGVCDSLDLDGDGIINQFDLDADNDGITDLQESGILLATILSLDSDTNGVIDDSETFGTNGLADNLETAADNGIITYTPAETDGDGLLNSQDLDSDNDGIGDLTESGTGTDTDNNGIVDGTADGDDDGILDATDNDPASTGSGGAFPTDTDGDGVPNYLDLDSDNDGITDLTEGGTGTDSDNNGIVDGSTDADGDGFLSSADSDEALRGSVHVPENTDQNGLTDFLDLDADDDGISDHLEGGTGTDANNDGIVDGATDADGDGVLDDADSDDSTRGHDHTPVDSDSDGFDDYQDIDADNDGIVDNSEGQTTAGYQAPSGNDADGDGLDDNYDPNSGGTYILPTNSDADGTADYLDSDSDNDGIPDIIEGHDSDGNSIADSGSPASTGLAGGTTDADSDGLYDGWDNNTGSTDPTNTSLTPTSHPNVANAGTSERDWREVRDSDEDGIADNVDLDDDNDGIPDVDEVGNNEPDGDEDGDGIPNWMDTSDDGNGGDGSTTNYTDSNGDGIPDAYDFDEDGVPNHLDKDSDNDGIVDIIEAGGTDSNQDGEVDYPTPGDPTTMTDADNDGLDDNRDDVDSGSGGGEVTSGIPWTEPNTDGAGGVNYLDIDADDDGIVDNSEAQTTAGYVAPSGSDTDRDGIDDAYDPDCTPCGGVTGSYLTPVNSEGTGNPDYTDTDTDDDGEADSIEGHDSDGNGTADSGSPASTGVNGGATDSDGDGLLDGWDNDASDRDPTNGGLQGTSHPNADGGDSERDWREVPCEGGSVVLAPNNTTTTANDFCEEGDFTYYYNPADPTELLFAIEHTPSGGNTNDFTVSIDITVSNNPTSQAGVFSSENIGAGQATFVMGRYYNITVTSGSLNGDVNVRFFYDTDESDALLSTAEDWNNANAGGTANVSGLRWFTVNSGTFDPGSADLQTTGIQGSTERIPSATGSEDGVSYAQFTLSSLTGGGLAYTVGTNSVVLPVKWLYFNATKDGDRKQTLLNWATATERNTEKFILEHSTPGHPTWTAIGEVAAAGQSQATIEYKDVHVNPSSGVNYYRLRQVDKDASYNYSEVRMVNFRSALSNAVAVFPNPNRGQFTITLSQPEEVEYMRLVDGLGVVHQTWNARDLNSGYIEAEQHTPGTYTLQVFSAGETQYMRVIVQ